MNDIQNRGDVRHLVHEFYQKVRADDLLGPIFNKHIADDEWPTHLEKLTDFWETNLFGIPKFKGNPTKKHIKVDNAEGYSIDQLHFGKWIMLWLETIDELFKGELAEKAKKASRKMGTMQFITIWKNRPDNLLNK